MNEAYEELIDGETRLRRAPTAEHERLVARLHGLVSAALSPNSTLRLLPPRSGLQLNDEHTLRPDLAIVRVSTEGSGTGDSAPQLYLVAEVLQPGDHHLDTVVKKQMWADLLLPRLWMIDPRYLNVEVYGCGDYGFTLLHILANRDELTDPYLRGLACPMLELFAET